MNRKDRFASGSEGEWAVLKKLMYSGHHYVLCGQEHWLPGWSHQMLRKMHGNPAIDAIRHFPDFATDKILIQAKSSPFWDGHPTVTIEKVSFDTSLMLSKCGIPVLITWYFPEKKPNNNDMLCQLVSKIRPVESSTERNDLRGSKTPMVLVKLKELEPWNVFIGYL